MRSSDLIKFRFALSINFDRKYCEARSSDAESRDKSFDLVKFRLELSIKLDRKYCEARSRDSNLYRSSQSEKKSRSIKNKEKLFDFSKKSNNSLSRLTAMKIARVIREEFAKHVKIFSFFMKSARDDEIKLFKRNDFVTFVQALRALSKVKVYTIYKRKNQKIKLSDTCVFDDFKSDDDASWKKDIIKKKKYFKNLIDQFAEFLISKFSELTKEARLKSERIQRMQIKNELLKREREFLLEMLFNREVVFFWDFIEKDSIRSKITSFMKIRIMFHEAWQILEFQISKALIEIVAEMIRDRIKNDVLEFCYESYRNSWFLVKKKKKKSIVWSMSFWRWIESSFEMRTCSLRLTNFLRNLLIVQSSRLWICSLNTINCRWLKNVAIWSFSWRRLTWWEWQRFS